ncbi:MAG: hypothetical protein K0S33_4127 [Bacteroidetes bacterium]|jgi:hypothetical protein|nr:hypothetical protein [Bacteroidota bacterium]
MIPVKRNTKEFKQVKELLEEYEGLKGAKRYIRLYSLKPWQKIEEAVLLNDTKRDTDILYSLAYEGLLDYIRYNRSKKLFREEKRALYYFKSGATNRWIEFPFEFMGKLKKQLFPLTRIR